MTTTVVTEPPRLDPAWVAARVAHRACCVLATASDHGPHAAAVLYVAVGTNLYVNTMRSSRKARNIALNSAVCRWTTGSVGSMSIPSSSRSSRCAAKSAVSSASIWPPMTSQTPGYQDRFAARRPIRTMPERTSYTPAHLTT